MAKRKLTRRQSQRIAGQQQRLLDELGSTSGDLQAGLVVSRFGKQADVELDNGELHRCHIRANLRNLVTGDRVALSVDADRPVVVSVEACRNRLERPDSYGKLKAVAANIDQMIIVFAAKPEPHENLIDRYLVVAENLGVNAYLLVNKSDLLSESARDLIQTIKQQYTALNYSLLNVSAKTGDGLAQLQACLTGKTSIFVGQSGVGKSSLLQKLLPDENLEIGELSEQLNKGKHTTTHSRLYHFPGGGNCIDSPGIREFGLWHFDREQVVNGFVELKALAGHCKFRDCRHADDPGCAIRRALEENGISAARFNSFTRIIQSLDDVDVKPTD